MVWLPDHIWEAQKKGKGKSKGSKGKSSSGGKSGWLPDHIWLAQKLAKVKGKGKQSGGSSWQPSYKSWSSKGSGKGKGKGKGLKKFPAEQRVWVGGIAEGTSWKDLQEHMNQAGQTKWVEVFANNGKGTGAVAYSSVDEAANAITVLNGSVLNGSSIECDTWQKTEKA
eukprot:TRINITY_DN1664_c0_g2_i1.p1 TRINITY_DN1664_c0_g2~~TRINITY_DN1664_c0_g2_i1.p1  ORF type:complete len:168 (-),score=53.86 TRINITY_DN1664_c0_g2_i1:164-667(-)